MTIAPMLTQRRERPSQLIQRPIIQFLVAASDGLLGDVSRLLNTAAELAILDGSERITLALLEQVAHSPMPKTAWPAVQRPFVDEAFGGWFGRVAGRYGFTVDELVAAANIQLNLNPDGSGWLVLGTIRQFNEAVRCPVPAGAGRD